MLETTSTRERVPLAVVAAGGAVVVVPAGLAGIPVYRGPGRAEYVCGQCGATLCDGVSPGMFRSLAFACRCGAVNAVR